MHEILSSRNLFVVKEHVALLKASNNYDVLDPETGETLLHCREPHLGFLTKIGRFTDFKTLLPFDVHITTPDNQPVLRIERGFTFLRSKVQIYDNNNNPIGYFKQKLLSIGGAFTIFDNNDKEICKLKGKWTSWEFRFLAGDHELAKVSKKWAGLGKELFTTADTYVLQIDESVPGDHPSRQLIMAAVTCIDMVLKE